MDNSFLVDTNILLTATLFTRPLYTNALTVLNDWPNDGKVLCTNGQILREYLVVATRTQEVNGLGLTPVNALQNVAAINQRMNFLLENSAVSEKLRQLIRELNCKGKQIHDLNLVATAMVHGVTKLVTANVDDFKHCKEYLEVLSLSDV